MTDISHTAFRGSNYAVESGAKVYLVTPTGSTRFGTFAPHTKFFTVREAQNPSAAPISMRIYLDGEQYVSGKAFLADLQRAIEDRRRNSYDTFAANIFETLPTITRNSFPAKNFQRLESGGYELRSLAEAAIRVADIKATVEHAKNSGAPIEFLYPGKRNGYFEDSNRRMNVKSVTATGFTATHARGQRRFLFSKVRRMLAETLVEPVGEEIQIEVYLEASGQGWLRLSTVQDDGVVESAPEVPARGSGKGRRARR